jgi:dynein heavy chain
MRQEITRAHKGWALDNVILDNEITRMMKEDLHGPPNEGKLPGYHSSLKIQKG